MPVFTGTTGADTLEGGAGADSIQGLAGADTIRWSVGGGADTVDGGADLDKVVLTGGAGADSIRITAVGGRAIASHNGGPAVDADNVEVLNINVSSGADVIDIGDLSSTDLQKIAIDLKGPNGLPDGASDEIILTAVGAGVLNFGSLSGTELTYSTFFAGSAGETLLQELSATGLDAGDKLTINLGPGGVLFQLSGFTPITQNIKVNGGTGDDRIGYGILDINAPMGVLTLNGGGGKDTIHATTNAVLNGDQGDDDLVGTGTLNGGVGDDTLQNNGLVSPRPGVSFASATLNGGADNDTCQRPLLLDLTTRDSLTSCNP
jgi:Ca2+-binding RTX toxin-like protein